MKKITAILIIVFLSACNTQTDYEKLYSEATNAIEKGNIERAIEKLDEAILINHQADSLYALRSYCLYQLGEYEAAVKEAQKAIAYNSESYYAYFMKGISKKHINVHENIKHKLESENSYYSTLDGERILRYKVSFSSNPVQFYAFDYLAAILDLNKSIEINNTYEESYYERGKLFHEIQENERALLDYNKAIELAPNEAEFYHQRALLYKDSKKPELALKDFNMAIEKSQDPFFYANRGYFKREQLNDEKGACDDFKNAEKLGLALEENDKCK